MADESSREEIRRAKDRIDILNLVEQTVTLHKEGTAYKGRCPFHADNNASLQVDPKYKNFKCFGCDAKGSVVDWIQRRDNLTLAEAIQKCKELAGIEGSSAGPRTSSSRQSGHTATAPQERKADEAKLDREPFGPVTATYEYFTESGELIFQVLRAVSPSTGKKDFRQRRPNPDNPPDLTNLTAVGWMQDFKDKTWIWKIPPEIRKPLYRAAELREAVKSGKRIHIPEGEKDVLRLVAEGEVATTPAGGAKAKWEDYYTEDFKGAKWVTIWRDNDKPGAEKAQAIYEALRPVVDFVEIVQAAEGKDAFDHLEAGWTVDDAVVIDTTDRLRSAEEVEERSIDWLTYPMFPLGELGLLAGHPGQGKSFMACAFAAVISSGRQLSDLIPGFPVDPSGPATAQSCIILSCEDPAESVLKPRIRQLGADLKRVFFLEGITMLDEDGCAILDRRIRQTGAKFIIVDTIVGFLGKAIKMGAQNEIRAFLNVLGGVARRNKCFILILAHLNKSQSLRLNERIVGSTDFHAKPRVAFLLGHHADDKEKKGLVHDKSNVAFTAPSIGFSLTREDGFAFTAISDLTVEDILKPGGSDRRAPKSSDAARWLEDFLSEGPRTRDEILNRAISQAGFKERTIYGAYKALNLDSKTQPGFKGARGRPPAWWALPGCNWFEFWQSRNEDGTPDPFAGLD